MTDARRMLVWMSLFLGAVALGCAVLYRPLAAAFEANPVFNGLILAVLVVGIALNIAHVVALREPGEWLHDTRRGIPPRRTPRLVAGIAQVLRGRDRENFRVSMLAMRSLLDSVRMRLDESREVSRYIVGLLIFLGLLGTFWGLLDTVRGVGAVVGGISGGDEGATFETLRRSLQAPLGGMGTAFSSSLFGLAGALVLGVLDLQSGHAQNAFYADTEEWLSGLAHLPGGGLSVEGDHPLPTYIEALLEQTADNLNTLSRALSRTEDERRATQSGVTVLADRLAELSDHLRAEQKLVVSMARNQTDLQPAMAQLAAQVDRAVSGYDEMREHLRSVDVSIGRLVDLVARAREDVPEELRREIRLLAHSLGREPA